MAKDLNRVMLIGRLGTDPELRYTQGGAPIATFRMATSRQWRDGDGNTREETDWFTVVAWNRLAEICTGHLHKGARAYVEGRLQNRSWDDQQTGEKRYRTEIIASDMIILESRHGGRSEPGDDMGSERGTYGGARSAGQRRGTSRVDDDLGGFSDEDIPF